MADALPPDDYDGPEVELFKFEVPCIGDHTTVVVGSFYRGLLARVL